MTCISEKDDIDNDEIAKVGETLIQTGMFINHLCHRINWPDEEFPVPTTVLHRDQSDTTSV